MFQTRHIKIYHSTLPPFHKSVHSSCPFDLGERPSRLLVLDSDEDVDYLQTRFFLPNLLKPLCVEITSHWHYDHALRSQDIPKDPEDPTLLLHPLQRLS